MIKSCSNFVRHGIYSDILVLKSRKRELDFDYYVIHRLYKDAVIIMECKKATKWKNKLKTNNENDFMKTYGTIRFFLRKLAQP